MNTFMFYLELNGFCMDINKIENKANHYVDCDHYELHWREEQVYQLKYNHNTVFLLYTNGFETVESWNVGTMRSLR